MKKCKGCGIELQSTNKEGLGYVFDLEQDYCQRCFRLSHYGDIENLRSNYVSNDNVLRMYSKYANAIFVVIIDVLDALCLKDDDLLEIYKNYNTILVINKSDILPENMNDYKIDKIFSSILFDLNKKYRNIKGAIISNKFENRFNENLFTLLNELNTKTVVFAGRANAGKSTLINKLINENSLTTSMYPGTTLEEVIINYKDYTFIDTPGLVDNNNYATYLNAEKYKLSKIDKTIKAKIFQLNEPQSYFYDGLLRVDIIPHNNASVAFYINNNNKIHRTKYENGDDYYQRHYPEFILRVKPLGITEQSIEDSKTYIIKGLGMFKISDKCFVYIHSLANLKLYESEVSI